MHRRGLVVTILIVLPLIAVSCGGNEVADDKKVTNDKRLTNNRANQALLNWFMNAFACRCNGPCVSSGGLPYTVTGIQELPQENAARAVLTFKDARINQSCPGARIYSGPGEARFDHYTDGRWVLAKVSTSEGPNSFIWDNVNIEAK